MFLFDIAGSYEFDSLFLKNELNIFYDLKNISLEKIS